MTTLPIDHHFDVAFADELAQKESYNKHLYRPNSYLHKWWARRCGTTFRTILKHVVADPAQQDYYAAGGLVGKIVLDPMMGGGTTLHEAIRLGANVVGADIDPIPVLQARASLSDIPLWQLEQGFRRFFSQLYTRHSHLYRICCPHCGVETDMRYMLYGHKRQHNGRFALFVDSLILRHNPDGSVIRICPDSHDIYHDEQCLSQSVAAERLPIYERQSRFLNGHRQAYQEETAVSFPQRYVPIAVVGKCPRHRLFFTAPDTGQWQSLAAANTRRPTLFDPADFQLAPGDKSGSLADRGISSYLDLFSSRQLAVLHHAISLLPDFEPLIRLNLALLVSTSLEFNALLCRYKGGDKSRPGAIRHVFAHHAYSFPATAVENNPIYAARASGSLRNLFESRIRRGRLWAVQPEERRIVAGRAHKVVLAGERDAGEEQANFAALQMGSRRFLLLEGSSELLALPNNSVDFIVTDPPYFDSVQYSDLAGYFHVWLRQMVPEWVRGEVVLGQTAVGPRTNETGQYEVVLTGIFAECRRVLGANGRFIFTFHHWNPKAWIALSLALRRANFQLVNRYVVHAENLSSVHIMGQNALIHDVILVLAGGETGGGRMPTNVDEARRWILPETVGRDSQQFCYDCGTILGWVLEQSLPDEAVSAVWQGLLGD